MKLKHILFTAIALTTLTMNFSCKKDETSIPENIPVTVNDPATGLIKLDSGYLSEGAATKVILFAKENLATGYNQLYLAVFDSVSGQRISSAHIHLDPRLTLNGSDAVTPFENPESTESVNGLFQCAVIFTTESSGSAIWKLSAEVHNHTSNKEGVVEFKNISVAKSSQSSVKSIISNSDSTLLLVTMLGIKSPFMGLNDIEFVVSKKDSLEFASATDLTLQIVPYMISMDHGSSNNIDPVHSKNGHYIGKANFSMNGVWHINVRLNRPSSVPDTAEFAVLVN